jgi:exonuclease SbcC
MKILAVKLRNINTLVGEWQIHFDRAPLSDTGLFAIVGPNGAGKSSILDGVTLALYGETSRLRSPEEAVHDWPVEESASEVTFSVGETTYRSRWSIRKAGHDWESPEMSLSGVHNGHETLLEDRMVRVRGRIAELTGLDFKRFCRSVLLAQGEFAAFLNAYENERAEILEKIMGAEVAEELEDSIGRRVQAEEEKLLRLRGDAEAFPPPDKTRLKELRESHQQLEEELRQSGEELRELRELQARMELRGRLELDRSEAMVRLATAEEEWSRAGMAVEKVKDALPAAPLRAGLHRLDGLAMEMGSAKATLTRLEEDLQDRESRLAELEARLSETTGRLREVSRLLEDRGGELSDALAVDGEIERDSRRFLEMVSSLEEVERSLKEDVQRQSQLGEELEQVVGRREEILRWLEGHRSYELLGSDLDALGSDVNRLAEISAGISQYEPQRSQAQEAESQAARQLEKAERALHKTRVRAEGLERRKAERDQTMDGLLDHSSFEEVTASVKEDKRKLQTCRELTAIAVKAEELGLSADTTMELAMIEAEEEVATLSLTREKAVLDELEGRIQWRDLVRRLASERAVLGAGTPCPLCGALDHPFVEQAEPDFSELDRLEAEHRDRMEVLQSQLESLQSQAEGIRSRSAELLDLQERWGRLCGEAGLDWTLAGAEKIRERIRVFSADIKQRCSNLRAARILRWRNNWLNWSLDRKLTRLRTREAVRDAALDLRESRLQALDAIDGAVQRLRDEEDAIRRGIGVRVEIHGESSPEAGTEHELMQRLGKRGEIYSNQRSELEKLGEELQGLEAQREALPGEIGRLQEESRGLGEEIEILQARLASLKADRETHYGTVDPEAERTAIEDEISRLSEEERLLTGELEQLAGLIEEGRLGRPRWAQEAHEAESAHGEAQTAFLAEMSASGFSSMDELRARLEILDEAQAVQDRAAEAETALAAVKAKIEELSGTLETLAAGAPSEATLDAVQSALDEGEKHHALIHSRWDDLERKLAEYRDAERERRELLAAVAVQEKLLDEFLEEQKVLRARDAAEARLKRQRLMLDRLVEQTNQHLAYLSGRYLLRSVEENGLGLEVEDSLRGRARRSVKTLSGGESFVVSLCLALGLSEMAARHRKIESLFLDEGFGALDDEMLFKVLAALKGLRANGKMVGIISHVKRLADEIPTQIRVDRAADGSSTLSIRA